MNALEELDKVLKFWNEEKTNPSTGRLTISGNVLTEIRAELIRLQRTEKAVTEWKSSIDWYPDRECFCVHCKLYFALEGSKE